MDGVMFFFKSNQILRKKGRESGGYIILGMVWYRIIDLSLSLSLTATYLPILQSWMDSSTCFVFFFLLRISLPFSFRFRLDCMIMI